jgi:Uma2 family endonuclease
MLTRKGDCTFDEFCRRVREDQKADLIDGVIYMASPENTDANRLEGWLYRVIADFADARDLGEVFISRVAMRLDKHNGPEPDILFVRKERLGLVERGGIRGAADLAVEIVSPDSVERDYEQKRDQYEQFGVAEYWIVDQEMQKVTLLRLGRGKKYREVRPKKGELHSTVLTGFWLRPEWIWQDPLPSKVDVLNQILARSS